MFQEKSKETSMQIFLGKRGVLWHCASRELSESFTNKDARLAGGNYGIVCLHA